MTTTQPQRWTATFPKDRRAIASDGTRLAYAVRGDGPGVPVAFINGWTCPDSYWSKIGPAVMDRGHPVIYLDLRGHGESGLPRNPGFAANGLRDEDVSAERLARDVIEVVEAAGFDSVVLVGHSMGVQAIIEAARLAPSMVAALVPVAGTFENPVKTFYGQSVLDRLYPIAEVLFHVMPFELLRPVLKRATFPGFGIRVVHGIRVGGPTVTADDMAGHFGHIGEINFSVLFKMMSQLRKHRTVDFLPHITQPTLVLAGRRDVFTPPSVQQLMADLIPGAEIVMFEEGGHLLPVEEADGIIAALTDFLARLESARLDA